MSSKAATSASRIPFFRYLNDPQQRKQLLLLSGIYLLVAIIIGVLYPYPFTTADSGNYVYCADSNIYGGYRPMGYSWFIRFFHGWGDSVQFVYIWQSVFNYIAVITFVFTLQYFFQLKNSVFYIIAAILITHPDIIHNTNTLLSDSLFNSLSLMWITTGIWMIMDRNLIAALLHCLLVYFVINVRYIGLFYPVISSLLFIIQFRQWKFLSALALLPVLILIGTINSVKNTTEKIYHQETFSAFSGWAAANNAVAMIPYIQLEPNQIADPEIRALHQLVTSFNDTCFTWDHIKDTDFMWDKKFPGKSLLAYNVQKNHMQYVSAWIYSGIQWKKYGTYLRNKYPLQYFSHFMIPNCGGIFEVFPYGPEKEYVPDGTSKTYFQVPVDKYTNRYDLFGNVYGYRAVLYWAMIMLFAVAGIWMIIKRKSFFNHTYKGTLLLFLTGFVLLYIAMSVFTHPIQNYRYLIPVYPVVLAVIAIAFNRWQELRAGTAK